MLDPKKVEIKKKYDSISYVESYDNRYRNLQYTKIHLLLQDIRTVEGMILDYGSGTGLLWDFFNQNNQSDNNSIIDFDKIWKIEEENHDGQQIEKNNFISEKEGKNTRFIGIDLSISMLYKFKTKISQFREDNKKNGMLKIVKIQQLIPHLICADGEHLPLRSSEFDVIFSLTTLQNLPHVDKGLEEIYRTLVNNGTTAIGFLKKSIQKSELEASLQKQFQKIHFIENSKTNYKNVVEDWIITASKNIGEI